MPMKTRDLNIYNPRAHQYFHPTGKLFSLSLPFLKHFVLAYVFGHIEKLLQSNETNRSYVCGQINDLRTCCVLVAADCMLLAVFRSSSRSKIYASFFTHTHTHTHTNIYIYIYNCSVFDLVSNFVTLKCCGRSSIPRFQLVSRACYIQIQRVAFSFLILRFD
jgi:hypothetical protein